MTLGADSGAPQRRGRLPVLIIGATMNADVVPEDAGYM